MTQMRERELSNIFHILERQVLRKQTLDWIGFNCGLMLLYMHQGLSSVCRSENFASSSVVALLVALVALSLLCAL